MNLIYGVRTPSDVMLVRQVSDWLTGSLGRLFGLREWYFERYMVAIIGDPADFVQSNDLFRARVTAGTHSACLYVVRDQKQGAGVLDTLQLLRTNASLLYPARISADGRYYITPHDESTFLEDEKKLHVSEMPQIYLQRLLDEWDRQQDGERNAELLSIARPALCLAGLGIAGLGSARISD